MATIDERVAALEGKMTQVLALLTPRQQVITDLPSWQAAAIGRVTEIENTVKLADPRFRAIEDAVQPFGKRLDAIEAAAEKLHLGEIVSRMTALEEAADLIRERLDNLGVTVRPARSAVQASIEAQEVLLQTILDRLPPVEPNPIPEGK